MLVKSGRHIVDKDGKAVPVEFDPEDPKTHAAAHGYEDAIAAGAAYNKLTPRELAERRVKPVPVNATEAPKTAATPKIEGAK